MLSIPGQRKDEGHEHSDLCPTYGGRYFKQCLERMGIPEESMPPRTARQIIHDELQLDGNQVLNLASFVTTWMEDEAQELLVDSLNKNFVDEDEYPQTKRIHDRVIAMMAEMFNCPADCKPVGTATVGSSEAIMLALLSHKWTWRQRRQDAGQDASRPNIVFGADVHTCWEKFARYFDVEARIIPMQPDRYIIDIEDVKERIDENTIAVGCVLGTTFTGQIDPIKEINDYLVQLKAENPEMYIPIHVDGASGGFLAAFAYPEEELDFRLEMVRSINTSNHKFGLVYPGMGTVLFKDESDLHPDLVFNINYLGGDMPNYSLNFSRPSAFVIMQYYNFLRLGRQGYKEIMDTVLANAKYLEKKLLDTGKFELLCDAKYLPVVVVRLKDDTKYDVYHISEALRERGWLVPAYSLPENAQDVAVLRMVVKENFGRDMADLLLGDLHAILAKFDKLDGFEQLGTAHGDSKHRIC
jgi:glutamate decarboxylase